MKTRLTLPLVWLSLLPALFCLRAPAQGTAFTYQGRLNDGAAPAGGLYDLNLSVHDAVTGGNLRGSLTNSAVAASNGLFTTTLDFGFGVFNGGPRRAGWRSRCARMAPSAPSPPCLRARPSCPRRMRSGRRTRARP